MAECVVALQTAEVVGGGPIRKAIRITGWDVESIEDAKPILQIRHGLAEFSGSGGGQIAKGSTQPMAPDLLAEAEVKRLQGLLHRLMAGEAGPFVMTRPGSYQGLVQIGGRLVQPVSGTVHHAIVNVANNRRPDPRAVQPVQNAGSAHRPHHTVKPRMRSMLVLAYYMLISSDLAPLRSWQSTKCQFPRVRLIRFLCSIESVMPPLSAVFLSS